MMTEVELKYEVTTFREVKAKLVELGGKAVTPSQYERNIVFDSPDYRLKSQGKLLRLRQYGKEVLLTVKEPLPSEKMKVRLEHESTLSITFDEAVQMLGALNYIEAFSYEKEREIWIVNNSVHICFDSLFFGDFIEIEGNTTDEVESMSQALGLNPENGIKTSYKTLQKAAEKRNFVKS